jgi:hypothetical protein
VNRSNDDRFCHYHDRSPAVAICAECRREICGDCHGIDGRGFARCASCRGETTVDLPPWERDDTERSPRAFAATLFEVVRHPRTFFQDLPEEGSPYRGIAFGFVCLVLGLLVGRIWQFLFVDAFDQQLATLAAEQGLSPDVVQLSIFVITPLVAAGAAGLHLALFKGSIHLFDASCSWKAAARITGYALGASIWMIVPPVWGFPLGRFLTVVWVFNLEVSAIRTYFELGPWRSMFAALLPLIGLMVCGI